jgi:hypothetical protein
MAFLSKNCCTLKYPKFPDLLDILSSFNVSISKKTLFQCDEPKNTQFVASYDSLVNDGTVF